MNTSNNLSVITKIRDILGPSIDQISQNNKGNIVIRRCQVKHDTMTCEKYEHGIKSLLSTNGIKYTILNSMLVVDDMLGKHFVTELETTHD